MSIRDQITRAIGEHGLWKQLLMDAIEAGRHQAGGVVLDVDVRDATACAFGRWLHGQTLGPAVKDSAVYREVDRLHTEFHQVAGAVLQLAREGKIAEAEAMMGHASAFAAISGRMTHAMMAWQSHLDE